MGKTDTRRTGKLTKKKHPHGCGEDCPRFAGFIVLAETPPRVWGRLQRPGMIYQSIGNTPTGVGKTTRGGGKPHSVEKHPHGCGEDMLLPLYGAEKSETPPRVWGRQVCLYKVCTYKGNTPTGVGKTYGGWAQKHESEKHPHGCGEDIWRLGTKTRIRETPPRVWGRRSIGKMVLRYVRNTPTGVGKTAKPQLILSGYRKHPHGCGEDR